MDPRRLLPALVVLAACACLLTAGVLLAGRDGRPARAPAAEPAPASAAREVLADWDSRRAEAWARGDVRALAALYVTGSSAGARDVGMLRRYLARGLRVEGMATQVLSLRVLREEPGVLDLLVTDRLHDGVVVARGSRTRLPSDRPSTRRVTMRLVGEEWLVAEVRGHPSAAASTSRTSSSLKSKPARSSAAGRRLRELSSSGAIGPAASRSTGAGAVRNARR